MIDKLKRVNNAKQERQRRPSRYWAVTLQLNLDSIRDKFVREGL